MLLARVQAGQSAPLWTSLYSVINLQTAGGHQAVSIVRLWDIAVAWKGGRVGENSEDAVATAS